MTLPKPGDVQSSVSPETSSALKLIAKGAGITLAGLAFSKFVSYLFRLIIARLGPDDYGLFSLGFSIFDITTTISALGIAWGVLRFVPEYAAKNDSARLDSSVRSAILISLASSVAFALVVSLLAGAIAQGLFHDSRVALVIVALAFAIPFYNLESIAVAICRSFKRIDLEVLIKYFVENSLKLVLAFAAVLLGAGFLGVTYAFSAAIALSCFFALGAVHYAVRKLPSLWQPADASSPLLAYSLPIMLSSMVLLLVGWSDTILLGIFRTVEEVGVYNTALPTASLLLVVPAALEIAFKPITVELISQRKLSDFRRVYTSLTKWIFLFNFPLLVFFVIFPAQVMRLLFGSAYGAAALPLVFLSVGYFVSYLLNLGDGIAGAFNKSSLQLRNSSITAVVSVVLNLLLVPPYGVPGAAVATGLSLLLYGVLSFRMAYGLLGFHPFSLSFAKIMVAAAIAAFLAYVFSASGFAANTIASFGPAGAYAGLIAIAMQGVVYGAAYAACAVLLGCIEPDDMLVWKAIKQRLKSAFPAR